MYAVVWVKNRFVGSETRKHNFENLNSISSISQETVIILTDPVIICINLNNQKTFSFSWPGERPSSHLKVTKMRFGPNIKYFSEPFFTDFCCC